jgi:DNA primase small subunit
MQYAHQQMDTLQFVKRKFSEYYSTTKIYLPPRFDEREFAVVHFGSDSMHRPLAFASESSVKNFLIAKAPMHVYHSVAYYKNPGVPMGDKVWLGADLVFDLDADQLEGTNKMSYEQQLAKVKEKFIVLLDDFLLEDFFDEKDVAITFSGGRGYHAHIRNDKVIKLGSRERRELVDYITGTFKFENLTEKKRTIGSGYERIIPGGYGWKKRFLSELEKLRKNLNGAEEGDAIKRLKNIYKLTKKDAVKIYDDLFKVKEITRVVYDSGTPKMITEHRREIDVILEHKVIVDMGYKEKLFNMILKRVCVMAVETDRPVTSDIKRLIRLPTSLHGKSSLMVVPLSRNELDDFRPLRDAVAPTFTDTSVKIIMEKPVEMSIRDEKFNLKPGIIDIPEYAAMFFLCRGLAKLC